MAPTKEHAASRLTVLIVPTLACLLFAPVSGWAQSLLCVTGSTLQVEWHGTWYPATVLAGPNDAGVGNCPAGMGLDVFWNGNFYAATIIGGPNETGQCQIHYDGYDDSWNETVSIQRLRHP